MSNKSLAKTFVNRNKGKLIWSGMTALEFFYGFETEDIDSVQFHSPSAEIAYDALSEVIKVTGERLPDIIPLHTEQCITLLGLRFHLNLIRFDFFNSHKLQLNGSGHFVIHPETVMMDAITEFMETQSFACLTVLSFGAKHLSKQCSSNMQFVLKGMAESAEQIGLGYDRYLRVLKQEAARRRNNGV